MEALGGIELPDVIGRIKAAVGSEIHQYQPMSNYASKIGHPCVRYLVHSRLDWEQAPKITPETKMLFDLGMVYERHVAKQYLEKAGFEIVEMDRPVQGEASGLLKRVKIHGKLDFIARDQKTGLEFPVEVKSMHQNTWEKIDSIEDMTTSNKWWLRQYPAQLMVYLLGRSYEVGLFLLMNKQTAEPKAIWVHQDYTYAEELIKKAELVNKHVEAGTYPDRIKYDDNVCGKCTFAPICLEEVVRTEAEILEDPDLIEDLEEREKLKPLASQYNALDKSVKKRLSGIEKGIAGEFYIVGQKKKRDGYVVEATEYFQTSIKKLGEGK